MDFICTCKFIRFFKNTKNDQRRIFSRQHMVLYFPLEGFVGLNMRRELGFNKLFNYKCGKRSDVFWYAVNCWGTEMVFKLFFN